MAVIAKLNYLRIAPRKVRLVADLIRGKSAEEAQMILNFTIKRGAAPLLKLLKSAIANGKNNFQLKETNLYIQKILVNEGPKYKRWRPRARGQAYEIQKKTSHVTIVLDEIEKKPKKMRKAKKVLEPEKIEEKIPKAEKPRKESNLPAEKAKLRPEIEVRKPGIAKRITRVFRRKAF